MSALNDKLPPLADQVRVISQNADTIFGRLYEKGYISEKQRDIMITEIGNIDKDLTTILNSIKANVDLNEDGGLYAFSGDLLIAEVVWKLKGSLMGSFENIMDSGILESLESIVDSHSINEMLNALSNGSKSYVGKDLIYTSTGEGGEPINVNISAALRLYREGAIILEDKMSAIAKLEKTVHEEIELTFKEERRRVLDEIYHIESNPKGFAYSRGWMHRYPLYEVESLKVVEDVAPLERADLDEQVHDMRASVDSGYKLIEDYRNAIEELFKEEEKLSQMFNQVRGI